ncbi:MAG TPA: VOC family protein, partial [Trebonia sp.]|nr:VOC family protein [Trebonia sp.]
MGSTGEWPEGLPAGAFRVARRSYHFAEAVAFYRDLVGLPLLLTFDAHGPDGFDGAIFGLPDTGATFEVVSSAEPVPVDRYDELVLYLPGPEAKDKAAKRLTDAGLEPVRPHQYWVDNDSVAFLDPDGREVIFAPWVFGKEPTPARRKGLRLRRGALAEAGDPVGRGLQAAERVEVQLDLAVALGVEALRERADEPVRPG